MITLTALRESQIIPQILNRTEICIRLFNLLFYWKGENKIRGINDYDVLIVGAGPAGSYTAFQLASKGIKVLLIDKCIFPRSKSCGGLLSAKTLNILKDWEEQLPVQCTIQNIRVYSNNFEELTWKDVDLLGKTVRRSDFDVFMLNKAISYGAKFMEGTLLKHIQLSGDEVVIETSAGEYKVQYAVGADGALSKVAKLLSIRPICFHLKMGFACSAEISVPTTNIDPNIAELYFIPFLGGFGWCFPLNGYLNIGVGASFWEMKSLIPFARPFINRVLNLKGLSSKPYQIQGAYIPAGGFGRCLGKERILLVGDAAGGVDSFSGEGIDHALVSAKLASQCIFDGLNTSHGAIYEKYTHMYDKHFLWDRRLSLLLAVLSFRKNNLQFNILKHNPSMIQWISNIMKTPNSYQDLFLKNLSLFPQYLINFLNGKGSE